MNMAKFDELLERRIALTRQVLASKAKEYADDSDKLANLRLTAAMLGCTVARACASNMCKHLASIVRMVDDPTKHSREVWDEKIGDAINYLILLESCVEDAR